ncbi:uncharacterized protein LOC132205773 [Neocloeon triangulifer]|uniref:uncharacterized protein LOC132205773 n=1 Tax=Neocloeon triangulifer TaxID=2078957 RepID=UPI00286F0D2A|nr:uncharacterized protein LOC132205773 [Neocloeon triangulifer]
MEAKIFACFFISLFGLCCAQGSSNFREIEYEGGDESYFCAKRNRRIFSAPDFGDREENLSFEGCGIWSSRDPGNKFKQPWQIVVRVRSKSYICRGILISAQAVITPHECRDVVDHYIRTRNSNEMQIYGGDSCADTESEDGKCFARLRLLENIKVIGLKTLRKMSPHTDYFLWTTNKIKFANNLLPICLYNRDNSDDFYSSQNYYGTYFGDDAEWAEVYKPEDCCHTEEYLRFWGENINSLICTKSPCQFFLINRETQQGQTRHYLRALRSFYSTKPSGTKVCSSMDINFWLEEIISLVPDLILMPKIPSTKPKIEFRSGLSFPNCGKILTQINAAIKRPRRSTELRPTGFVFGGLDAEIGTSPWHASLTFHGKAGVTIDACGGTLISNRAIVTAAHCFFESTGGRVVQYTSNQVEVTLGKYDAEKRTEDSRQSFYPNRILVHSGYDHVTQTFEDDIALLIFDSSKVELTEMVQPACLWDQDYSISSISHKTGEVAGYGKTAEDIRATVLQKVELNIASHRNCFLQQRQFFGKFLKPTMNFCAGKPNEAATCIGDSGGGLTIYRDGRHYLRGVVSSGILKQAIINEKVETVCNPKYYSLFTDVTNYMDWIVRNVPDIQGK